MGVCQSADEVRPVVSHSGGHSRHSHRRQQKYPNDLSINVPSNVDGDDKDVDTESFSSQEDDDEERENTKAREDLWLAQQHDRSGGDSEHQSKRPITDTVCPSCAAPVLAQSLRSMHFSAEEHDDDEMGGEVGNNNPLLANSSSSMKKNNNKNHHRRGSHFVCASCWESSQRAVVVGGGGDSSSNSNSPFSCIFCLVEPVLAAIQKYGFCDVTFARWLQVIASCTGKKNRLVCAASIIANSGEPSALASFSAAPKETAAGMIISISCILEDRFPLQTIATRTASSSRRRPPTTPFARRTVSPRVVQLWIEARESLISSVFAISDKSRPAMVTSTTNGGQQQGRMVVKSKNSDILLNAALTRLYVRAGLSYRALTLAGHPCVDNIHQQVLQQIALCASESALEAFDDSHHSVESIRRSATGLNHDILREYPPFMFQ